MSFGTSTFKARLYLYGAFAAAINSAVSGGLGIWAAPDTFDPWRAGTWIPILKLMTGFAVLGFLTYMKAHPLPDPLKDIDAPQAAQHMVVAVAAKATQTEPNQIPQEIRDQARAIVNGGQQ